MGATAGILTAVNTGLQFIGQQRQAGAVDAQGKYEAMIDRQNAGLADQQAADAIQRGQIEEGRQRLGTKQEIGATRASIAGQGVDVGSGSALDVQGSEAGLGEMDALTIRNNAAREAWGYNTQAAQDRQAALMSEFSGKQAAAGLRSQSYSTLITGGLNTYGMFSKYASDKKDLRTAPERPTTRPPGKY